MRLMKVEIKPGLAVKMFRVPSTAASVGSYRVVLYRKNGSNQWDESLVFNSLKRLKHAEMFYNWALTRVDA